MTYDVDFFINKFSAIPEGKWGVGTIYNNCAYWHCDNEASYDGEIALALTKLFASHFNNTGTKEFSVISINDGISTSYKQPTPKQRILAALQDIKKLNNDLLVKECDATKLIVEPKAGNIKTVIKYVSVPETIHESLPETILS